LGRKAFTLLSHRHCCGQEVGGEGAVKGSTHGQVTMATFFAAGSPASTVNQEVTTELRIKAKAVFIQVQNRFAHWTEHRLSWTESVFAKGRWAQAL
jgi:hypothetical protein